MPPSPSIFRISYRPPSTVPGDKESPVGVKDTSAAVRCVTVLASGSCELEEREVLPVTMVASPVTIVDSLVTMVASPPPTSTPPPVTGVAPPVRSALHRAQRAALSGFDDLH